MDKIFLKTKRIGEMGRGKKKENKYYLDNILILSQQYKPVHCIEIWIPSPKNIVVYDILI